MRLLLLALTILVFIPQVIPGFRGKKCSQNIGRCKKTCNVNEEIREACKNRRVCCVPAVPQRKMPTTVPTTLDLSPIDYIVVPPWSTTDFAINTNLENGNPNPENENSPTTARTSSKLITASRLATTPGGI